jgi:hypothetical protein
MKRGVFVNRIPAVDALLKSEQLSSQARFSELDLTPVRGEPDDHSLCTSDPAVEPNTPAHTTMSRRAVRTEYSPFGSRRTVEQTNDQGHADENCPVHTVHIESGLMLWDDTSASTDDWGTGNAENHSPLIPAHLDQPPNECSRSR